MNGTSVDDDLNIMTDSDVEPIKISSPPRSTLADLAYWYGRAKEIWPNREVEITIGQ